MKSSSDFSFWTSIRSSRESLSQLPHCRRHGEVSRIALEKINNLNMLNISARLQTFCNGDSYLFDNSAAKKSYATPCVSTRSLSPLLLKRPITFHLGNVSGLELGGNEEIVVENGHGLKLIRASSDDF